MTPISDRERTSNCPTAVRRRRRRGFTLIELLVVISIIGLLVAMLLPSLSAARATARNVLCMNNLRSFAQQLLVYELDFKRFPEHVLEQHPLDYAWPQALSDGVVNDRKSVPAQMSELLDLWKMTCPFVDKFPSKATLEANRPLEEIRLLYSYAYWPGYAHDATGPPGSVTWGDAWVTSDDQWTYTPSAGGKEIELNILASDIMWDLGWTAISRFNHPTNADDYQFFRDASQLIGGLYFATAYRQVDRPGAEVLPRVDANFAYVDGSVHNRTGDHDEFYSYPIYHGYRRGWNGHWLPAQP